MAGNINNSESSPLLASQHPSECNSYDGSEEQPKVQSPQQYDATYRWRSIRICNLTFFISSLGFSICMSSVWPYMQQSDPLASEAFLGWVIAAFSIGQLIASPLLGLMSDKMQQAKAPLLLSLVISLAGSLMYSYVHLFPSNRRYALLAARFIIGVGAANGAVIRSFVAGATTIEERTQVMATVSMTQSLGFIIGPAIQAAFTSLSFPGPLQWPLLTIDMYTSAGLLSFVLGVINIVILVMFFKEFYFEASDDQLSNTASVNSASLLASSEQMMQPDKLAASVCIAVFCVLFYNFSVLETVITPMTQIMYAWNEKEASLYNGIALAVCGVISIFAFASIRVLVKIVSENDLIVAGMALTFLAFALLTPWLGAASPRRMHTLHNATSAAASPNELHLSVMSSLKSDSTAGCPDTLNWCQTQPALPLSMAIIGIVVHSIGYPIAMVMVSTVISKILGPMRQGTWMGLLTGGGSLSRCIGPVAASEIFAHFGPQPLFISCSSIVLLLLVLLACMEVRLVPYDVFRMRRQSYSTYSAI